MNQSLWPYSRPDRIASLRDRLAFAIHAADLAARNTEDAAEHAWWTKRRAVLVQRSRRLNGRAGVVHRPIVPGDEFDRLTVEAKSERRRADGQCLWECRCRCGATCYARTSDLNRGDVKSCGCLRRDMARALKMAQMEKFRTGVLTGETKAVNLTP
jgi:hypothetical protein